MGGGAVGGLGVGGGGGGGGGLKPSSAIARISEIDFSLEEGKNLFLFSPPLFFLFKACLVWFVVGWFSGFAQGFL